MISIVARQNAAWLEWLDHGTFPALTLGHFEDTHLGDTQVNLWTLPLPFRYGMTPASLFRRGATVNIDSFIVPGSAVGGSLVCHRSGW